MTTAPQPPQWGDTVKLSTGTAWRVEPQPGMVIKNGDTGRWFVAGPEAQLHPHIGMPTEFTALLPAPSQLDPALLWEDVVALWDLHCTCDNGPDGCWQLDAGQMLLSSRFADGPWDAEYWHHRGGTISDDAQAVASDLRKFAVIQTWLAACAQIAEQKGAAE